MLVSKPISEPICKPIKAPLVTLTIDEGGVNTFEVYITLDVYDNLEVFS